MLKFDNLYIPMIKQNETDDFVWYKFEVGEYTDKYKIDNKGRKKNIKKIHTGVFKFNKKIQDNITSDNINRIIKLEENQTDPLLLNYPLILIKCFSIMKQHQKGCLFPKQTCYAAG